VCREEYWNAGSQRCAGLGPNRPQPLSEGLSQQRLVGPAGDELVLERSVYGGFQRSAIESGRGAGVLWGKTEHASMADTIGLHLCNDVHDVRMPVAHTDIDLCACLLFQQRTLLQRPARQRRAFGQRLLAQANLCVSVLQLCDDLRRHRTTAGDLVEVGCHLAELVGSSVREQQDYGLPFVTHARTAHSLRASRLACGLRATPNCLTHSTTRSTFSTGVPGTIP